MAKMDLSAIVGIVVSLIFVTALLPYGLVNVAHIGDIAVPFNGTTTTLNAAGLTTVVTLMTTLIPLAIAIGLILYYMKFTTSGTKKKI